MLTLLLASVALAAPHEPPPGHLEGGHAPLPGHEPLRPLITAAADEFGVPEVVLAAMVWEATRWDASLASQWAGYGPLDLREEGTPSIEEAAASRTYVTVESTLSEVGSLPADFDPLAATL